MPKSKHETKFVLTAEDKTKAAIQSAKGSLQQLDGMASKLATGFALLGGAGGIGLLVSRQVEGAKQAIAYSEALGVGVENLTAMQYAAESVNIPQEKMADILKDVSEKIGDAYVNKGGEAVEALKNLNLSVEDMNALSPDQQLLAIADALENVQTKGEKIQIMESLANDATLLIPLLEDGGARMQDLMDRAKATGVALTDIEATKLIEVGQATRQLDAAFESVGQSIVVNMATPMANFLNQTAEGIGIIVNWANNLVTDDLGELTSELKGYRAELERLQDLQDQSPEDQTGNGWGGPSTAEKLQIRERASRIDYLNDKITELRGNIEQIQGLQIEPPNLDINAGGNIGENAVAAMGSSDLDKLRDSLLSAEESLVQSYSKRRAIVRDAHTAGDITEQEHNALLLQLREQYNSDLFKLEETQLKDVAQLKNTLISEDSDPEESSLVQQLNDQYQQRIEIANTSFENEYITEEHHLDLMLALHSNYDNQLTAIMQRGLSAREKFQAMSAKNQTKTVLGELTTMTAGIAQHSRAAFEINKTAGIAQALIGAHEGANKSLAAYPWPLGGIMAGLSYAAGIAQVDAIRSTSFNGGGGGTTPSAAGSTPTVNDQPVVEPLPSTSTSEQGQQLTIFIKGDGPFRDLVRDSIEVLNDNDELRIIEA